MGHAPHTLLSTSMSIPPARPNCHRVIFSHLDYSNGLLLHRGFPLIFPPQPKWTWSKGNQSILFPAWNLPGPLHSILNNIHTNQKSKLNKQQLWLSESFISCCITNQPKIQGHKTTLISLTSVGSCWLRPDMAALMRVSVGWLGLCFTYLSFSYVPTMC